MKLSYCVSTMGKDPEGLGRLLDSLAAQDDPAFEVVIVLQTRKPEIEAAMRALLEKYKGESNLVVMSRTGLTVSRNEAFRQAKGDVIVTCDDDCTYPPSSARSIKQAYLDYPDADVITLRVRATDGSDFRKYPEQAMRHSFRSLLSVCSVEVTLRRSVAADHAPLFDERVGLGTSLPTGAENLMLTDLVKKGLRLQFVPCDIVRHPVEGSGRGHGVDLNTLAYAKGYLFARLYPGIKGVFIALAFFGRHLLGGRALRFGLVQLPHLCRGIALARRQARSA